MSVKLNVDQICSIHVFGKEISKDFEYKEYRKSFWGDTQEGFYYKWAMSGGFVTKEFIEADGVFYCEGKTVYYHPHVDIKMSNGQTFTKIFKKERDLDDYLKQPEFVSLKLIIA